jgi:translocation and assembly module TamA
MIRPFLFLLCALLALACGPLAAQDAPAGETEPKHPAATESFEIRIQAPDAIKTLLEKHLELRRYREVSDLDDTELARLLTLAEADVRELVGTLGYFSPNVLVTRDPVPGPKPIVIIAVDPGQQATVADVAIEFEGDIATSTDTDALTQREGIRTAWPLPVGQGFAQSAWDGAKTEAIRQLTRRRYPAARISYSLADIDPPNAAAHLGLRLDSGPLFHLGEMQVSGVQRYDPVLVPRLARLPAGSIYDRERIVQAQLRLTGSGYYDSAYITVDPQADPEAAPLQVTVREAPLQKVTLGLGITTDSGPRASIEHTHNQIPVLGWRALTKLQFDRKTPFGQTEWTAVPDPLGWRWAFLARAERLDDDDLITHAQRLRFGRLRNEEQIDRNVFVQLERARVQTPDGVPVTAVESGAGSALSANYIWTGRYFDSTLLPTRGNGFGLELGAGVTLDGPRLPFQRTLLRYLGMRPLTGSRLQFRGEAGAVLAKSTAQVPSTQLFRTGGDTSVRGYGYRDIGVTLPNGKVGPGRMLAVGSVEWQRPIRWNEVPTKFESLLFVDAGGVADKFSRMRASVGVGTGVRWSSPVGPLEVDLAYGIQAKKFRLHMNVGFVF